MLVYIITNNLTNDTYIGKTTKTLNERFNKHCQNAKNNSQTYFHRAIRKYGKKSFSLKVLENLEPTDNIDEREIFWISKLKPTYNMTKGGEGGDTSSSPNFISSLKKRRSTKGMTYEEIYGHEKANELKLLRSEANGQRDYSKYKRPIKGMSSIEYFGEERHRQIQEKRVKSMRATTSQKRETKEKLFRKEFIASEMTRRQFSESKNISYSTMKKYLKGL